MSASATIPLLEVEPDVGRYLTEADVAVLDGLAVPAIEVASGELHLAALMSEHSAFGMIVLEGMLVRRIVVGDAGTLRLLGPGDLAGAPPGFSSMLITDHSWRAAAPTRMAVLGREVLLATYRAPRLVAGLHALSTEQNDRTALQLAICQLPRVEDRLLSLLWLLAETWGQVTGHGTALRLHLTHETLGGLIGARRSTVTLALGQLTDEGAILRQERGWLLLEPPPSLAAPPPPVEADPEILEPLRPIDRAGLVPASGAPGVAARVHALREETAALLGIGEEARRRLEGDLKRLVETRRRSLELRETVRAQRGPTGLRLARLHHHDHPGHGLRALQRQADDPAAEGLAAPVDGVDD